jgi:hypothetical protein
MTGRPMPDFKATADSLKDNGGAIRRVCREFVRVLLRGQRLESFLVAFRGHVFQIE